MDAKSMDGVVDVDSEQVVLRFGLAGRVKRRIKEHRIIPGWAIAEVELSEPRATSPGFLRIRLEGDHTPFKASTDPNTVEFHTRQLDGMRQVADAISELAARYGEQRQPEPALLPPTLEHQVSEQGEPAPAAPAAHSTRLPWWYELAYKFTMASLTLSIFLYAIGCLALVIFAVILVAVVIGAS
jgi:hypothetical protein